MVQSNNGPNSPDAARSQANSDVAGNRGPALTHNWHHSSREAYEAEYARQKAEQNKQK